MLVQEKLLRVIEYGQLERVGGSQPLRVDVRLVCATNDDLPALAAAGKFRADLLDRLAFDVVQLPPLRQRRPDIMLLAEHFAIQMCRELALPLFPGFTERARQTLLEYGWPGNVRELKNVVERSVYRHGHSDSPLDEIIINPFAPREAAPVAPAPEGAGALPALPLDLKNWQLEQEKVLIEAALQQGRFNQRKAAQLLGLPVKAGLAMASGFGWYSLSGILITDAYGPVMGSAAFFNDLARELVAIMLIPTLVRRSRSTALGLCGATSMDFTLPVLQRSGGLDMVPPAIVHGFLLSLLAPVLIALFS